MARHIGIANNLEKHFTDKGTVCWMTRFSTLINEIQEQACGSEQGNFGQVPEESVASCKSTAPPFQFKAASLSRPAPCATIEAVISTAAIAAYRAISASPAQTAHIGKAISDAVTGALNDCGFRPTCATELGSPRGRSNSLTLSYDADWFEKTDQKAKWQTPPRIPRAWHANVTSVEVETAPADQHQGSPF